MAGILGKYEKFLEAQEITREESEGQNDLRQASEKDLEMALQQTYEVIREAFKPLKGSYAMVAIFDSKKPEYIYQIMAIPLQELPTNIEIEYLAMCFPQPVICLKKGIIIFEPVD